MDNTAPPVLLAAARVVDGHGTLASIRALEERLREAGARMGRLEIDSLRQPWAAPTAPGRESFQSGCAPIMALARAREMIGTGEVDAVEICGDEPLRSGYDRAERLRRMQVYPEVSVPEAYTRLAALQMAQLGIDPREYRELSDALLDNYRRTARQRGLFVDPHRAERACTSLFRYADCANPYIDFAGGVLLGSHRIAARLGLSSAEQILLLSVAVETVADGPAHLTDIVGYAHLRRAYQRACTEAGISFTQRFLARTALLEAYTCFPPVPLAFLLASGIATSAAELLPVLERHPVTVTGGMNLAGAPWNNPALNALIVMHDRLVAGDAELGLVHGNGGVGGYQGVAILGR